MDRPVHGRHRRQGSGLELLERSVNGVPGLVARRAGVVLTVASFDISDGCITRIRVVRNPEKLRPWEERGYPWERRGVVVDGFAVDGFAVDDSSVDGFSRRALTIARSRTADLLVSMPFLPL